MKITDYVKETKGEMAHVSWPTRRQAIGYTIVVIALSIFTALFLGLFDFLFSRVLGLIV